MTATLPSLAKLKLNTAWASLPLFDRTGWKRMAFGQFAESIGERAEPRDAQEEIYVGLEHLDPHCLHIRRWGKGSDVIGGKLRFRKGDIIFGKRRAYQRKLAVAEFGGICSAHAMVIRARPDKVLPEFLPFLMMSDRFMSRAVEISVGSLSPTINWTTLKLEQFDLPPLNQQRRIAEICSTIDEAISRKRSVDVELKAFSKVAKKTALETGQLHNGKCFDLGTWGRSTLGSLCELQNGRGFASAEWSRTGLPIVRIQNLNGSREFNYYSGQAMDAWIVEPGTLLFAWAGVRGVSFGPCIWDGPRGVLNQHIFRVVPRPEIDKRWLFETLVVITQQIEKQAHGFKLELVHARKGDIINQPVWVPPRPDQEEIADYTISLEYACGNLGKELSDLAFVLSQFTNTLFPP